MQYAATYIQAKLMKYFFELGDLNLEEVLGKCNIIALPDNSYALYATDAHIEYLYRHTALIEKALQFIEKDSKLILWDEAKYQEHKQLLSRPCDYTLTFSTLNGIILGDTDLGYLEQYAQELHIEHPFLHILCTEGAAAKHLLHAIGNCLYDKNPNTTILISTGDHFVSEVTVSMKMPQADAFNYYYKADAVLISDIQFIEGNDAAQNILADIISYRIHNRKITVLTSNKRDGIFINSCFISA